MGMYKRKVWENRVLLDFVYKVLNYSCNHGSVHSEKLVTYQMDVKSSFLNEYFEQEFVEYTLDFEQTNSKSKVLMCHGPNMNECMYFSWWVDL